MTLCTLVTLYFAKEVPLEACPSQRLSDSAPLLHDRQNMSMDTPKVKAHDSTSLSYNEDDKRNEIHHDGNFNEGPGDVMVKLLTSIRHLPPAMHSVLLVTALTWVCFSPLNFLLFKVYDCRVSFAFIL